MISLRACCSSAARQCVYWFATLMLVVIPLPIAPLRQRLAGRVNSAGELEFYSHPDFVCVCHLVWIGWLVGLAGLAEHAGVRPGLVPHIWLNWIWLIVLVCTLLVLGLKFGRVACGFLASAVTILLLILVIAEMEVELPLRSQLVEALGQIPVRVDWGIPLVTSAILGVTFAAVSAWQSLNDRWILPARGSFIEHVNFQQRDRSISKGAKSFVACYDCLIRRYLCFGYGDIEVRSANGQSVIDRIEGVYFAGHYAERMKRRLSITDVALATEEEIEEEQLQPIEV